MSSANPSNAPPDAVVNCTAASARRRSSAGLTKPGQVPGDHVQPARVERVDERPELRRADDVGRLRVVRRLEVDGLHAARGDGGRHGVGLRVRLRGEDRDPGAEPGVDRRVRGARSRAAPGRSGATSESSSGDEREGDERAAHDAPSVGSIYERTVRAPVESLRRERAQRARHCSASRSRSPSPTRPS